MPKQDFRWATTAGVFVLAGALVKCQNYIVVDDAPPGALPVAGAAHFLGHALGALLRRRDALPQLLLGGLQVLQCHPHLDPLQ